VFVVFEGLDGCGKSTLMRAFKSYLSLKNQNYTEVFDPGGTPIGDKVRQVLLDKQDVPAVQTELLLYQASRSELVFKLIKPALDAGKWVISDRYYQSTLAFQGFGRGISIDEINWLNSYATGDLKPDVVVWVNTPVDVCSERLQKRKSEGEELSRLDEEKRAFHQKVYEGYKSLSKENNKGTKWLVLDGEKSPQALADDLIKSFDEMCG
jgi:dTMP kinase